MQNNNNTGLTMTKNANGSFTLTTPAGQLTLTRAQFCAMLSKTPITLLPKRF